jgi:molecular chaperone GrpE (heat shock protein)
MDPTLAVGQPDAGETESETRIEEAPAPAGDKGVPGLLAELAGRLDEVEKRLGEFHQRAAHREGIIDRLHEENQRLHDGFGRMVLEPVVADLIRLYDQLDREADRLEADGRDGQLMRSFAEDVAEILDRCGFEVFSAEVGDPFERGRHRPVELVACDDESVHNTVAEVVSVGFFDRDADRVRRPVHARFHQYSRTTQADPASDTAQSR